MTRNSSIKNSSRSNIKGFSNLESSLFTEIDMWKAEKLSGGAIKTSPQEFAVSQETNSSKWALSIMF